MSMKYLIEGLQRAVLAESKASIGLRQVAKDFGASSAASQVTDDNVRDVSIRMVDNLVRHSLKMAMRQPAGKVAAFNPSAMLGRIRAIDPITDVDSAFSASKILAKTVERASEEGSGTTEVAAVQASVNALRSLRTMLRKNPDAATSSINALSSDIATAATAIGAASKSPRHVKMAIVNAITGEALPSEESEEESAPKMEARSSNPEYAAAVREVSKLSQAASNAYLDYQDAANAYAADNTNADLRRKYMIASEDAKIAVRAVDAAREKVKAMVMKDQNK